MPRPRDKGLPEGIDLRRGRAPEDFWQNDPDVPDDLRERPPRGDPRVYGEPELALEAGISQERIDKERAKEDRFEDVRRRRAEYLRQRFAGAS